VVSLSVSTWFDTTWIGGTASRLYMCKSVVTHSFGQKKTCSLCWVTSVDCAMCPAASIELKQTSLARIQSRVTSHCYVVMPASRHSACLLLSTWQNSRPVTNPNRGTPRACLVFSCIKSVQGWGRIQDFSTKNNEKKANERNELKKNWKRKQTLCLWSFESHTVSKQME